jgi:hypothetical protein
LHLFDDAGLFLLPSNALQALVAVNSTLAAVVTTSSAVDEDERRKR